MFKAFDYIRIVLVNTSHPGNIGAAARAMKTMGLKHLYLVQPEQYPCAQATARAAGADDVLANAQVCESLSAAVSDCTLVIGTSARERRLELPMFSPGQCAEKLVEHASGSVKVALVFGRERFGLTNEELDFCGHLVNIPSNPDYSSLNLAAAVQVLSYELHQEALRSSGPVSEQEESGDKERSASAGEIEGLHEHLHAVLCEVELITPEKPKQMLVRRLRRLFQRAQLSITEVNILRGILSAVQGKKAHRTDKTK